MKIKSKGFTLVELLVYMGIFSMLTIVLTQMFISILDVRLESQTISSVEQDGRYILARFMHDIHKADSMQTPVNLGDQGNSLQLLINGVTNTYSLNSNNLQVTNNLGTILLTGYDSELTNLNFKRLGNTGGKNTIQITFTIQSKTQRVSGSRESKFFQTTIGTR